MKRNCVLSVVLSVSFCCGAVFCAEGEDWNLPAPQRVAEGETLAARGEIAGAERILRQLENEAKATGSLAERTTAEARVDRLRLAVARAHVKGGSWPNALTLLNAIELEGKSPSIQRAICAATLDALKPLMLESDGQCVAPWTPLANDKFGPQQPSEALRAPYTRVDRKEAAELIAADLTAWERIETETGGVLTDSEKATAAALSPVTRTLVRYAWGVVSYETVAKAIDALPAAERRLQALRLTQLLLREHDLARAVPRLLDLEKSAKDDVSKAAAEELIRISVAYERLRTSLPMWNPGVDAAVKPYLADPAWAAKRDAIVKELDKAIGAVDLKIVLGGESAADLERGDSAPMASNRETSDVVVPADILAKAELGDHFETINPDVPDTHSTQKEKPEEKKETPEEKEARAKLDGERQKRAGEKPSRYHKLGYLAGVLRKNVLLDLDPKKAGSRETREEYELQVDHQEFMIEALGPDFQKDTSQGFRPLTPDSPLRLVILSRYHGDLDVDARRLPNREAFEKLDAGISPETIAQLPVAKNYTVPFATMLENLAPYPTKGIHEIKTHGLAPGFYVLTARARYSPVVAVTRLAVSETKVVVRHAPKEILIWTLDRITGTPHASKLKGEIKPNYIGQQAWGGAELPRRDRFDAIDATRFYQGLGDELNRNATDNADESYAAGVAEGKKLHDKFPLTPVALPTESDASGLARVEIPAGWRGHRCAIHVVADGCDVDAIHDLKDVVNEKVERVAEWVADRPVARPGQTVKIHGFVRENHNGRMIVARGGEIPLKLTAVGATLFEAKVAVDENGACDVEQIIDADTPDGLLSVQSVGVTPLCAIIGGEVATRRVRLELPAHPMQAGSRVKARAIVESAAGIPLVGIALKVQARFHHFERVAAAPLPFGEEFAVATASLKGDVQSAWNQDREVVSGLNGDVEFQIEIPDDGNMVGQVLVVAPGGRRAQASAEGRVLGLASGCVFHIDPIAEQPAGKPARLTLMARTLEGTPYTKPFQIADANGRVITTLTPDQNGRGVADVQLPPQLYMQVRPSAGDDGGWQRVSLNNQEPSAEVRGERGVLAARLDRKEYRIGETAHVYLRADRPALKVLMTTESSGVTRAQIVTITERAATVDIPIGDQDAPNATIALTALADDKVECVLLPLDVAKSERELTVQLTSNATKAEPGQTVQMTATVKDARGQAVANSSVVAAAFDVQLLSLADDPAPEFGLPFLAAGRVTHDVGWTTGFNTFSYGSAFVWLTPEWSFGPYGNDASGLGFGYGTGLGHGSFGARGSGGRRLMVMRHGGSRATVGTEPFRVRARFSEQALWSTKLTTGADGTVTFPFVVPDNLTTFRTVAYALDTRGYPGKAMLDLPVQRDVELTLDLPPELREGDRTEVALNVWNYSDTPQSVSLKPNFPLPVLSSKWISAEGAKPVPESLEIAPRSSASIAYMLDVKASALPVSFDTASNNLRFDVSATNKAGAKLDQAVFNVPLRLMGHPEHQTTQAVVREKGTVHVPFSGSFDPLRTSLTLTIRRGLRGLALDIRELQYVFPEHCPEQTLSRFVPAMVLASTLPEDQQTAEDHQKLERVLKSGIARMRTLHGAGFAPELQPLSAWYLRRLAQVPAGLEALRSNADWIKAAEYCENMIVISKGNATPDPFPVLSETAAQGPQGYGGFRSDLWTTFGASQSVYRGGAINRREVRARFTQVCQSCIEFARKHKLAPHDRALAGLLCAQLGFVDQANELLRLRLHDAEFTAPVVPEKGGAENVVPKSVWFDQQERTLAVALDVMTAVELKQPEAEILELALRLQDRQASRGAGFGTTFLNGVGLLALADAMKVTGVASKEAGSIVVSLGKFTTELPAGADVRRVTIDSAAVETAFKDGWDVSVAAPAGQLAGIAIDRTTLQPEKVGEKSADGIAESIRALRLTGTPDANTGVTLDRCLFVRPPADAATLLQQNWRPYAGQPLPLGTELLVVTKITRETGTEFVQVELPTLPGWEALTWNEEVEGVSVEFARAMPGMLSDVTAAGLFAHETVDGNEVAGKILESVRERHWGEERGSIDFDKKFITRVHMNDRGSRLVFIVGMPRDKETTQIVVQSGALRAPGRCQLPGARAWCWYNPLVDVTSAADLVQVAEDQSGSLEAPGVALATQAWLEKAWTVLARDGWKTKPSVEFKGAIDLHALALTALGRSDAADAKSLVDEWLAQRPKIAAFTNFQQWRQERYELVLVARSEAMNSAIRAALLSRYASWDGVRADWKDLGLGALQPPDLDEVSGWLATEKSRTKELLPFVPAEARATALAMQALTVRDALALWFGADTQAANAWLWRQPAETFVPKDTASLDEWAVNLRKVYGLEIAIDPRAPLVLSLPAPEERETLAHYVQNHLAAAELVASGFDAGKSVMLSHIGAAPDNKPTTLDAKFALSLRVFTFGSDARHVANLREALALRGIQLVAPDSPVAFGPDLTLREALQVLAKSLNKSVRVESDIIELK